jgi:hypothetical protein
MRKESKAKIHFFKKFFNPFFHVELRDLSAAGGIEIFTSNAQFRPTKGGIISKRYEKTKHSFCFELLPFCFAPLCLSVFVAESQSIKNNKLCKTNPICRMLK